MKNNFIYLILIIVNIVLFTQEYSINFFVFIWIILLILVLVNKKNHFISFLLVLEILSLRRIVIIGLFNSTIHSLRLIFILITLRVGEAVLGLAILVKLIRWTYSEFILRGLN